MISEHTTIKQAVRDTESSSSVGWGDAVIFTSYGPFHAQQRKLYQDAFGKNVVSEYRSIQEHESTILLRGLLDDPRNFDNHLQRYVAIQTCLPFRLITQNTGSQEVLLQKSDTAIILTPSTMSSFPSETALPRLLALVPHQVYWISIPFVSIEIKPSSPPAHSDTLFLSRTFAILGSRRSDYQTYQRQGAIRILGNSKPK